MELSGPQLLRLDEPGAAWLVEDGTASVFAAELVGGVPAGRREHLCDVAAGQVLVGLPLAPDARVGVVALASERCRLKPLTAADLVAGLAHRERPLAEATAKLVDSWLLAICGPFDTFSPPEGSRELDPEIRRIAGGEALESPPGVVSWLRLREGRLQALGLEMLERGAESTPLAVGGGLWARADGPCEIEPVLTADLDPVTAEEFLAAQLSLVGHALQIRHARRLEEGQRRFLRRQEVGRETAQAALEDLASLVKARAAAPRGEDDALLAACRIVGERLGLSIQPPARSEDLARVEDTVQAIARASRIRVRTVLLEPRWWLRDGGPLVAYLGEEGRPVALLPISGGGYEIVDPAGRSRRRVDAGAAVELQPAAVMFYRSLPAGKLRPLDLLRFAGRGNLRDLGVYLVIGQVGALFALLVPQATGMLIDQAIPDANRGLIFYLAAALLAASIGSAVFDFCEALVMNRVTTRSDAASQAAVLDRVLNLPAPFFRQFSVGDLHARIMGVHQIRERLSGNVLGTVFAALFSVQYLAAMVIYSPKLVPLAIGVALVTMAVTVVSGILKYRIQQTLGEDLSGNLVQLITGISKIRVAGAEHRAFAWWARHFADRERKELAMNRVEDVVHVIEEVLPELSTLLLYLVAATTGVLQIQGGGQVSTGAFLAFAGVYGAFIAALSSFGGVFIDLLDLEWYVARSKPLLQTPAEVSEDREDPGPISGRIALDQIVFRYSPDARPLLDGLSLHAEPGESIALVGPSGCGKSTVFRLLLGFETPEAGAVVFDGQDLAKLDPRAIRRQMGVVLQSGKLMQASVFENIACGALMSRDEAWDAARLAGLDEDIRGMAMGLETVISEGGGNISGGQRQRLMLARAFARRPRIMLLDEATSALDNRTQAIVTANLDRLKVTRVVIAHRLSTIREVDRIYVIDQGQVVQAGTFDDLASREGLFRELATHQLA